MDELEKHQKSLENIYLLIARMVKVLGHSRPHVYASRLQGVIAVVEEIDAVMIEADGVIHWSDDPNFL